MFLAFGKRLVTFGGFNAYFGIRLDQRRKSWFNISALLATAYFMWFMVKWAFIGMALMMYGIFWLLYMTATYVYMYPIAWAYRKAKGYMQHRDEAEPEAPHEN